MQEIEILQEITKNYKDPQKFASLAKSLGYKVTKYSVIPPNGRSSASLKRSYWLNWLVTDIALSKLEIEPPDRPKPDFIDVDGKINSLPSIGIIKCTEKGNPANPAEFDRLGSFIDGAVMGDKYDKLEALREQFHPNFAYEARLYYDPHVTHVGKQTIRFRPAGWGCVVNGIRICKPILCLSDLVNGAKSGYTVWKDGFCVKGQKALEWTDLTVHFKDYFRFDLLLVDYLIICLENGIKIFRTKKEV